MRQYLSRHEFGRQGGFRWRNPNEISRIEGFSDAVFAFAVTLLVVSLEVPKTFEELKAGMYGFPAFAAAFALLFVIWTHQYKWFREYALQDGVSLWLNAALLFVVLFFTYPLKFLFGWLTSFWMGRGGLAHLEGGETVPMVAPGQQRELMLIYGLGYMAVFLVLFLLYLHAWRRGRELELTPEEWFHTRSSMQELGVQFGIGLVSVLFAWNGQPGYSGMTYLLIGPSITAHATIMGRKRRLQFPARI